MRRPTGRRLMIWPVVAAAAAVCVAAPGCDLVLGISDYHAGPCPKAGATRCAADGTPEECSPDGQWLEKRCDDNVPQHCDATGKIKKSAVACDGTFGCNNATGKCNTNKIDLLLVVRNGSGMAGAQQVLAQAVPDLVGGLVNPACIEQQTMLPSAQQPLSPLDPCPTATAARLFSSGLDVHIGMVSTSLGGHGSDACPNEETNSCPGGALNTSNNDKGRLLSRVDPCGNGIVPTYESKGFLAWDPKGALKPPGEGQLETLDLRLKDLTIGAGVRGCGYASDLESWYRFLVDPNPYQTINIGIDGQATPEGTDDTLLQQRKDFLRPDSLLVILLISDANDCSVKEYGSFYFVNQQRVPGDPTKPYHLPRARSECAADPDDPCCLSCGQSKGDCKEDPSCAVNGGSLDDEADPVSLRCWDQKRRFGIDFLYPIDRYVTGLTSNIVPDREDQWVPNPIYGSPGGAHVLVRDPSRVFFAAIVGVPWQDLAVDPMDATKGFMAPGEMAERDAMGLTRWEYIIGDRDKDIEAHDSHMLESTKARSGTNPITGTPLAPPGSASGTDPINGHEHSTKDTLQYACIFDMPQPIDCSPSAGNFTCDCADPMNDNPLCEPDPNHGGDRTLQVRAKAYPGIRQLSLVKALGSQGIAGSLCTAQLDNPNRADFGYRPILVPLLAALKGSLPPP